MSQIIHVNRSVLRKARWFPILFTIYMWQTKRTSSFSAWSCHAA